MDKTFRLFKLINLKDISLKIKLLMDYQLMDKIIQLMEILSKLIFILLVKIIQD